MHRKDLSFMYPINLILDDKECLILGGGAVAAQKAQGLLNAGAAVTVLSPSLCPPLQERADQGDITWLKKLYEDGDEIPFYLIICASNDSETNSACAAAALSQHKLVNVCDAPQESNWTTPSVVRRGDILCSISSNGKSPAFTRWMRHHLEQEITPDWSRWLDRLAVIRQEVRSQIPSGKDRQAFWRSSLTDELMEQALGGQMAEAEQVLWQKLAFWLIGKGGPHAS